MTTLVIDDLSDVAADQLRLRAAKMGRSVEAEAREAILQYLDDIEDERIAFERIREGGPRIPLEELKREFASDREP